ncbi:MAG: hypothetical protein HY921_00280 [Elusimicrobia bacterium]|nr:hypothetical protein [Elusimicrobiota bacterium]
MKNFLAGCLVLWFGIYGWSQGVFGITADNSPAFQELSSSTDCPQCWKRGDKPGPVAAKTAAGSKFKIICELDGKHGSDPDRLEHRREIALVGKAYEAAFESLPPHLQETALETVAVINHKNVVYTKSSVAGWSAEDDPEYVYPDRGYFPNGTIKVNYTEYFVRILELAEKMGRNDPKTAKAFQDSIGEIIAHELLHAWQYHRNPVRDLMSVPGGCPQGLCDEGLLEETRLKLEYESQAFETAKLFDPARRRILADALEKSLKTDPKSVMGPLLSEKILGGLKDTLRAMADLEDAGKSPMEAYKTLYYGQYIPARNVRALVAINQMLERENAHIWGDSSMESNPCANKKTIFAETAPYLASKKLPRLYPYVAAVKARYQQELERLEKNLRWKGIICE